MLKISEAIKTICSEQPLFAFGLHNKVFNLSALAKLLRPMIEARTKKPVKDSAILMSLSRLQTKNIKTKSSFKKPPVVNITIHSNLCSISFFTNKPLFDKINQLYNQVKSRNGYISVIQGVNETNLIIDENFFELVGELIKDRPKNIHRDIASLNIQLDEKVYDTPGQFYFLVQAISFQGINIREISSAFSEVIFYLDQADIKLAFDTIYNSFQNNNGRDVN
jgi:aspartokinase